MKKLLFFLFLSLLPMMAIADDSGTCGENVTWTYNEATKTITISGTGEMEHYGYASGEPNMSPWKQYVQDIEIVIIESGITIIGSASFRNCRNLKTVTIPNSVSIIAASAFQNCSRLTSLTIPSSVTGIGQYVFSGCTGLTSVSIPNSVTTIGDGAFNLCI